jgi:hypothetical protein
MSDLTLLHTPLSPFPIPLLSNHQREELPMRLYTLPAINNDILQLPLLGIDPLPVDNSVPAASLEHGGMVLIRDIFDFGRGDVETCGHEDQYFEYRNVGGGVDCDLFRG